MLRKFTSNKLIFAVVSIAILFASIFLTWQMSFIPLTSSPINNYCLVEISGIPLPVRYSAVQYDFYDEATKGTIFAECIWPEFEQTHTIKWQNAIINWVLYLTFILSVVNLFRKKMSLTENVNK